MEKSFNCIIQSSYPNYGAAGSIPDKFIRYFGEKNGTNYFVNTIIHKYLVGPYSSGIPKLLYNFEIPCSLNGRGSNREPRTY